MRRTHELESLLTSQLLAGPAVRRLSRLRRAHPELAFEIDQICVALKQAAEAIARFHDPESAPESAPDRDAAGAVAS